MRKKRWMAAVMAVLMIGQMVLAAGCGNGGIQETRVSGVQESSEDGDREKEEGSGNGESGKTESGSSRETDGYSQGGSEREAGSRELQAPRMTKEEYPRTDGSTATLPLSMALYQLVTGASQEEAEAEVVHTKTTSAYLGLITSVRDLVIAYEPSQAVYDEMESRQQELIIKPIGKDALVFMANEGNPVTSLSGRQLTDIYSGRYKDWSQVGGEHKELIAFQRPVNSGSQTLMEKLVMKGIPMAEAPQTRVVGEMGELIEQVASYNNEENALGYSVYFYARNMYQKPGLRFMAVDGVMPDNQTIKNGTYPYVNEFYAAVRKDEPTDSSAYKLFQWLTEPDGQALIESLGYVGMEDASHIHRETEAAEEPEKGDVKLEADARILIDGSYLTGNAGVVVLGPDFQVQHTISNKRIETLIENIRGNEAVIMTNLDTKLTGLYSVGEGKWTLGPVYENLWKEKEGMYSGYRDGKPCKIIWNQKEQRYEERPGGSFAVGDFWWSEEGGVCRIYKGGEYPGEDSVPVRTIDCSGGGRFHYGYEDDGVYIACYEDGSQEIYDQQGRLIFGEEILGKPCRVYDVNRQCRWIWAAEPGSIRKNEESFLYDYERKQVITRPGDIVEDMDASGGNRYFSVIRNGKPMVCDEQGTPVRSKDNQGFERIFGGGWCGRQKKDTMVLENPATGEKFDIPWGDQTNGYRITGSLFFVVDTSGRESKAESHAFYLGGNCLMKGEFLMYQEHGDICALYGEDKTMLLGNQGEILYESNQGEQIPIVFPEYLVIQRGNYLHLTDYEGRTMFRQLMGYMGDD